MNLSSDKLHKQNLSYSIQGSYNSITLSIMRLSIPKYKKKGYVLSSPTVLPLRHRKSTQGRVDLFGNQWDRTLIRLTARTFI